MSIYEVTNVVAMRNCFVTTAWTMNVVGVMAIALMVWCASSWVGF